MTLPRGFTLDQRYQLGEQIGVGGIAEVYRATDLKVRREVAVKVLRAEFAADRAAVERFLTEAERAAGFAHVNAVQVSDYGLDASRPADAIARPYVVMEFVEGETFKDLVGRGPVEPHRAVSLMLQVLSALAAAHRRGLVHCDIKSRNLLVTAEGVVKVTDFGIASEIGAATVDPKTGMVVASPHYCSPEQAMGQPATPASDLYSAGVVLYELLTGRLPFPGDDPAAVARAQVTQSPPAVRSVNPRAPAGLEAIVMQALAKTPDGRFGAAEAMAAALRGWQAGAIDATMALPVVASDRTTMLPADDSRAPNRQAKRAESAVGGSAKTHRPTTPGFNWVGVLLGLAVLSCALASYGGYRLLMGVGGGLAGLPNLIGQPSNPLAGLRWPDLSNLPNPLRRSTPTPGAPAPTPIPPTPRPPQPTLPPATPTRAPTPPPTATRRPEPTATAIRTATPPRPTATPTAARRIQVIRPDPARVRDTTPNSSAIRGLAVDPAGRPVTGLVFQLREQHGFQAEFPSGPNRSDDGRWWFVSLGTGKYTITVTDPVTGLQAQISDLDIISPAPPQVTVRTEYQLRIVVTR